MQNTKKIEIITNIEVKRMWDSYSVRKACIGNNWYTAGDNEDYTKMLDLVDKLEPTTENLYTIARDIKEHSDDQTISNVMFCLEKDAISTFYTVEGEEF